MAMSSSRSSIASQPPFCAKRRTHQLQSRSPSSSSSFITMFISASWIASAAAMSASTIASCSSSGSIPVESIRNFATCSSSYPYSRAFRYAATTISSSGRPTAYSGSSKHTCGSHFCATHASSAISDRISGSSTQRFSSNRCSHVPIESIRSPAGTQPGK